MLMYEKLGDLLDSQCEYSADVWISVDEVSCAVYGINNPGFLWSQLTTPRLTCSFLPDDSEKRRFYFYNKILLMITWK